MVALTDPKVTADQGPATASIRTLGYGTNQAAQGSDVDARLQAMESDAGVGDLARMFNSAGTQVIPKDGAYHPVTIFDTVAIEADGWVPDESGGSSFTIDTTANTFTCLREGIVSAYLNMDGGPLVTESYLGVLLTRPFGAARYAFPHSHGGVLFLPLKANDGAQGNGGGQLLLGPFPVKAGQTVGLSLRVPPAAPSGFTVSYVDLELMMVTPGPIAWPPLATS